MITRKVDEGEGGNVGTRGRPRIEEDAQEVIISVRVTKDEAAKIDEVIAAFGATRSQWLREVVKFALANDEMS